MLVNTCYCVLLTLAILMCRKWYFIVLVLICISLMANYVEYLFMCLLVICVSSLKKCVFTLLAHVFFFLIWLCWIFVAACGLSLVVASRGYSSLRCACFSLRRLPLLRSPGSRCAGSRAQAQQLWHTGLVALWHVGSSRTRARTCVPCIGRRILNHCATKEALAHVLVGFVCLLLNCKGSL